MARSAVLPLILCALPILSMWVGVDGAGHRRTAVRSLFSSVDCSSLILDLADCLNFVANGSTVTKPEGTCCSGLKTALKTDAQCLCDSLKNSTQFGVSLNITKTLSLPAACKLHAPSVSSCGLAITPAGAPAPTPSIAGVPTAGTGGFDQAPSRTPQSSGSQDLFFSVGSLVVGLILASFSGF